MEHHPVILWGVDPIARLLVLQLLASEATAWPSERPSVFDPQTEPLPALRNFLAREHETARCRGASVRPHVVLMSAAFAPESESIAALLVHTHAILKAIIPDDPQMTLVALLPPLTADDSRRTSAFHCFQRLEPLVGALPLLRNVLVLQLRSGISASPSPAAEESIRELRELLGRTILDPTAARLVAEVNPLAIGNVRSVNRTKCGYSTVGRFALIHPAQECVRHLRARFHRHVFHGAFLDEKSVAPEQHLSIQKGVDNLIQGLLELAQKRLPGRARITADAVGAVLDSGQIQAAVLSFQREVDGAIAQDLSALSDVLDSMEKETRTDLRRFIPTSPGYLAGVHLYLAAVQGKRLWREEDTNPAARCGVPHFRRQLCVDPFITLLLDALEPQLARIAEQTGASLPQREPAELRYAWLVRAATAVEAVFREMEPGERSPARFFAASFRRVRAHLDSGAGEAANARELVDALVVDFAEEAGALLSLVTKTKEARTQAEGDLYTLRAQYSAVRRALFPPGSFRLEQARLLGQIRRCEEELAGLQNAFSITYRQFLELINDAVLPYAVRSTIAQRLTDTVAEAADHYSRFVSTLTERVGREVAEAAIPVVRTTTAETILTPEKVETLYERTLAGLGMPHFAQEILHCDAEKTLGRDGRPTSYAACRSFADHYFAGPNVLYDRMRDYSEHLFRPVCPLGVLDILELHGRDEGYGILANTLKRTKGFLPFTPATLAQVENEGVLQAHILVRTGGGSESRLAVEYLDLFRPHVQFFDSEDPNTIDITCLTFGIPAFLIHALQEGRSLSEQKTESTGGL
jgi:hypothetical protein